MDLKMKQRLVGLLVVLALLAIFIPLISYKMEPKKMNLSTNIPNPPEVPKIHIAANANDFGKAPRQNNNRGQRSEALAWAQSIRAEAVVSELSSSKQKLALNAEQPRKSLAPPVHTHETPTKMRLAKNDPHWLIQLGTFSNSKNINSLLQKLFDKGIPTFEEKAYSVNGQPMVRIYVGPMMSQNEASDMKRLLKQQMHISGIIKRKIA